MYKVANGVFFAVLDAENNNIIEATSASYAIFLCELLNSGVSEADVKNRPAPDNGFYEWLHKKSCSHEIVDAYFSLTYYHGNFQYNFI